MKFRITVRAMDDEAKKSIAETGEQNKIVLNCSGCTILTTDEDGKPSMSCIQHMTVKSIAEVLRHCSNYIRAAVCIAKGKIDADNIMGVHKAKSLFDLIKESANILHSDDDEDDEECGDED